jgi:hypothetical protein
MSTLTFNTNKIIKNLKSQTHHSLNSSPQRPPTTHVLGDYHRRPTTLGAKIHWCSHNATSSSSPPAMVMVFFFIR